MENKWKRDKETKETRVYKVDSCCLFCLAEMGVVTELGLTAFGKEAKPPLTGGTHI